MGSAFVVHPGAQERQYPARDRPHRCECEGARRADHPGDRAVPATIAVGERAAAQQQRHDDEHRERETVSPQLLELLEEDSAHVAIIHRVMNNWQGIGFAPTLSPCPPPLPPAAAVGRAAGDVVKDVLDSLTPREAKVLRMRFGIEMSTDHTLEEVGKQFDVTRERIRQIEAKALRKLRQPSRSKPLRDFIED